MQVKNKISVFCFTLISLIVVLFFLSLSVGQIQINFYEILRILVQLDFESTEGKIIFLHRMPKSIVAILTGIALPTSGFLLQELFKNPLAGPSVLGISSTSALGVAVFIFFGVSFLPLSFLHNTWLVIVFAFLGALVATFLLLLFSIRVKSPNNLIIIGFILSAFSGALISFMEYLSPSDKIKEFIFWGFGSFSGMDWTQIFIYAFCVCVVVFVLFFYLKDLSLFILGNAYAKSFGVNVIQLKLVLLLLASFLTALSIAFTGPILFIGIIIPYVTKLLIKTTHYNLLLLSICLIGILFTLSISILIDCLPSQGIPINVISSIIGGPIIIYAILNENKFKLLD